MKKKILIISGTHGNEQSAVELGLLLKGLYRDRHNVHVIPFLNKPGLIANTRDVSNSSTTDLNRSFGETEESYAGIVRHVKKMIDEYDYVIDIHNSPRCANFCLIDKGLNADKIADICSSSYVEYAHRYSNGGTIKDYVNQQGKLGFTYEFAGMSTFNNNEQLMRAYTDIMYLVDTLEGNPRVSPDSPAKEQELCSLYSLNTGFVKFVREINDTVEPGDIVFKIINEEAEIVEVVRNPEPFDIKLMAFGTSFTTRGSSVVQYITKD